MLTFEPNVVVIDDKPDEVKGIIDHYRKQGIGCRYFNTDKVSNDTYPDKTFSDASIVFLDLYFSDDINSFDAELCVDWVGSIIPEKSFYILIIWTREIEHQQEILDLLKKRHLLPFKYIIHNKTDFISSNQEKEKYNFEELMVEINSALDHTPALSEIGIWKRNIKSASNRVIGGLTKDHNPEIFKNKLQKIIVSQGGTFVYTCKDINRKRGILFEALDNVLISNAGVRELNENNIGDDDLYNIGEQQPPIFDRELNSWFHFKLNNSIPKETISAGLLCTNEESHWKDLYSIQKDERINKIISKQENTEAEIENIALLINRPCDIAQRKYGNNLKLLSGIKISNPVRKENAKKEFLKGDVLPDSCKLYDHLYFSEEEPDVALLFDFRYVFSVPEKVFIDKFKNIKIFNKELLSEIQVEYASYSSRLGITQIL